MKKIAAFIASGSGMGADAAKHLSSKGYDVAIMSSSGKGEELAKKLGGFGYTGSNLSSKDIDNFLSQTLSKFGKIDALINSAGHGPKGEILEISDEDWIKGMEVYFLNVVRAVRVITPMMQKQKNGSIINISTFAIFEPDLNFPTSGAFRSSLAAFTKIYSDKYSADNIRRNNKKRIILISVFYCELLQSYFLKYYELVIYKYRFLETKYIHLNLFQHLKFFLKFR